MNDRALENSMIQGVTASSKRLDWTRMMSFGFSGLTLCFLAAMIGMFVWQSLPVWNQEGLDFLTTNRWHARRDMYGALSMLYGTGAVCGLALCLAAPLGLGTAIFMAEIASSQWRLPAKIMVELLAGIPSVIYGLLGILFLRNWVYDALEPFDPLSGDTLLTAGILLAVMILPTVVALCDDALRGVPATFREASRGLGLTRAETLLSVSLPQAWRGIMAAWLLALGRALGEGIAVFMVIGRRDNQWPESMLSLRPLMEAGQSLTSKLVSSETNLAYGEPLHWAAMINLGLVLVVITAGMTWIALVLSRRKDLHA